MKCHPVNLLGSLKQSGDMVGEYLKLKICRSCRLSFAIVFRSWKRSFAPLCIPSCNWHTCCTAGGKTCDRLAFCLVGELRYSQMPYVTEFKNRSIDNVQNLGNERRYIYKDPRQDSGQRNISYTRYPKKCFTQTYRDLYGDAMLVLTWMSSNMADGNQQKHLLPSFATKAWIYSSRNS